MRWAPLQSLAACAALLLGVGCGSGASVRGDPECSAPGNCGKQVTFAARFNHCPVLEFMYVSNLTLNVGFSTTFGAIATDPDGDEVHYDWTATGGELSAESDPDVFDKYTCQRDGTHELTLWLLDSQGCAIDQSMPLDCLP
jgi:hypothetical protein